MKTSVIVLALLLMGIPVKAQSDFVKPGSIGQPSVSNSSCTFTDFSTPLITCWVGQKILFLPQSKDFQHFGYQLFKRLGSESRTIPYEELAGKVGTITNVMQGYLHYDVTVVIDDTQKTYIGEAYGNEDRGYTIDGIALLRELQDARNALKGRTVWLSSYELGQYDDAKGKTSFLPTKGFRPTFVEDVVAGSFSFEPVRLIVKTESGAEGYVDISYSGVNSGSVGKLFTFDKQVSLVDPRKSHNWSSEVWVAIENKKVIPGMTMEQVRFFLPQNHTTDQTTTKDGLIEQWTFKSYGLVTFLNGTVSSFTTLGN